MILALVDDLLFSSKIKAAADAASRPLTFVRNPDAMIDAIRTHRPDVVIVDLDRTTLAPIEFIRNVRSQADVAKTRIVGYVSHVKVDVIESARAAGIDQVMARSAFVNALPRLVAGPSDAESALP
jgi:DNA-binding NarL/FixJ family response regulator